MNEFNELILKRDVLAAIREEMPVNRMDTDEEVAMERLYHRIVVRIEQLPATGMARCNTSEAGEKMKPKKPYKALDKNRRVTWVNCPCCQRSLGEVEKIDLLSRDKRCKECGQELDWSDFRGTV